MKGSSPQNEQMLDMSFFLDLSFDEFPFLFFVFGGPKQLPCLDPQKTSFVSSEFFLTQPPPITWSWLGVFTIVSKGHF